MAPAGIHLPPGISIQPQSSSSQSPALSSPVNVKLERNESSLTQQHSLPSPRVNQVKQEQNNPQQVNQGYQMTQQEHARILQMKRQQEQERMMKMQQEQQNTLKMQQEQQNLMKMQEELHKRQQQQLIFNRQADAAQLREE